MGVADRYENKKRLEEATKTTSNGVANRYNAKNTPTVVKDIESRLKNWNNEYKSLLEGFNSRFFDKDGNYISDKYRSSEDAGNWLYDVETKREALEAESKGIMQLLNDYGDYFDKDFIKEINSHFNSNTEVINQITSGSLTDKEYWDKFKNEDEYKEAIQAQKEYEAKATADLGKLGAEIDDMLNGEKITSLKSARDKLWDSVRKYNRGDRTTYKSYKEVQAAKDKIASYDRQIEDIQKGISEKQAFYNQADRIQKGIKMAGVADATSDLYDPEFGAKSQYNPNNSTLKYEFINNANKQGYEEYSGFITDSTNYNQMTEDEIALYNYYYATGGSKKADEYLDLIQDTLNYRKGEKIAAEKDTWIEKMAYSVTAGLDQFGTGMANLFNFSDDYIPTSATQYASGMIRKDLGGASGVIYDLSSTTFNMAPSILTSMAVSVLNPVAGQVVGAAMMGASASGNAYAEALNLGYSKDQARGYSLLVGASEAGLQYLLGGIGSLGGAATKGLTTKIATSLASNFDKALAKVAVTTGTKLVGNMISEFGEEYLQEILHPVFKNIALGTNEDFKLYTPDALYAGFLGALSAGILEGGSTIAGEIGTYRAGKKIVASEQTSKLVDFVKTSYDLDSVAYKIADKVTENTDAYTIGQLLNEAGASLSEQNVADIARQLEAKGVLSQDAQTIAKWMYKSASNGGSALSGSQVEALKNNPVLSEVMQGLVIEKSNSVNTRTSEYKDILDTMKKTEAKAKAVKALEKKGMSTEDATKFAETLIDSKIPDADTSESSPAFEDLVESKFEVSDDGKTTNLKTGKVVEIKQIESISESGEANLTVDDGMVVKASDISYGSDAEAAFVGIISNIKIGDKPISAKSANALYHEAMTILKSNPEMNASEANSLIRGLAESYLHGAYRFDESRLTETNEDGTAKRFAGELTDTQRSFAYKLGAEDRFSNVDADQKLVDDIVKKAKAKKEASSNTTTKKGSVRFEDGVVAKGRLQKRTVTLAKHLAKIIGMDIVFYDARTTLNPNGKDANGFFDEDTDTIHLDLQNSHDDAKTIVFTLSHELVHFIKKWSPKKFDTFAKFLMEQYTEHGVDTEQLLKNKMAELGTTNKELAYEEMICDACERMLLDSDAVYKLMELRKSDLELFDKIKLHIHELLNKISAMYKSLGLEPTSVEAKALLKMEDVLEQMYALFEDASVDAVQSYQAVQDSNEAVFGEKSVDVGKTESGVKNQLKNHKKIGEDATSYNERHKKVHKAILKVGIETMYEMAETMLPYLDVEGILPPDIPGKTIFKNGSYGKTGENTTLCVRTLTYEDFKDRISEEIGRPLTVSESLLVSQKIYDIATDPQCIYCYVAADRKAYDAYLGEYWNAMDKYIKAMRKGGDSKALYTEYLAGRKDTDAQKKRWASWETIAKSGREYISAKDLTTKRKRDSLIAKKNAFSEQIKDAQRYAQSASWAKTVFDYRAYKGDILKMTSKFVDMLNSEYGLRMYSFSDYTPAFIVENMQMLIDASVKGLKSLAYTKDTDYAEIFASTGQAINVSCFARWDAKSGTFVEDNRQGANWAKTKELRNNHKNVGAVMVCTNDAMVEWALKQDWVDVVIPYHIVKTGTTIANEYGWNNYTSESADKVGNKTANIYPTEHNNDFATYSKLLEERGITPRFSRWYDMVASGVLTENQYMKLVNEVRLPASELSPVVPKFNLEAAKRSFGVDNDGKVIEGGFVDKGGYMGGWYREGVDVNQEVMAVSEDIKAGKSSLDVDYGMSKAAKEKVEARYKKQAKPSKRDPRYLDPRTITEKDVFDMLENTAFGAYDNDTYIPLRRNTPEFFIDVVKEHSKGQYHIEDYPIASKVRHLRQNMEEEDGQSYGKERPHELSVDDIITISRKMGDPSYIVLQENGRYAEVVSFYNKKNKHIVVAIDMANGQVFPQKNYKHTPNMNGYDQGLYNIVVTQYEPDDLQDYLSKNEVVYDKKEMNGKYQVGSGRIVTVTHDTPFIEDIVPQENAKSQEKSVKKQLKKALDKDYLDAVNRGDVATQERLVSEAAKSRGYTERAMHGTTSFGFTKLDVTMSDDGMSFFATDSLETASTYASADRVRRIGESAHGLSETEFSKTLSDLESDIDTWFEHCKAKYGIDVSVFGNELKNALEEQLEAVENGKTISDAFLEVDDVTRRLTDTLKEKLNTKNLKLKKFLKSDVWYDFAYGDYYNFLSDVTEKTEKLFGNENGIYDFYVNPEGLLIVNGNGSNWNNIKSSNLPDIKDSENKVYRKIHKTWTTRNVALWAKDNGYTGVKFIGITDAGNGENVQPATVYTFFNPKEQVKSADPITYDDNGDVIPLSERFNAKNEDIRYQKKRNIASITETEYKDLEKNFGTTGNFRVAGYLLTNGKLLDFSGKHWGDTTSRTRQVDHREAEEVLGRGNNGVNAMIDMIGNGNIRLMPEVGGINLAVYPNEKQRKVLSVYINYMLNTEGEIVIDYDDVGGDTVYSKTYGKTATSRQILNDIRNYFNGGRQSELMQFHTMYQKKTTSNRSILANSLESAAQNDIERNKLTEYKKKISLIEAEEKRLAEIHSLLFTKGAVEPEQRKALQFEAKQISNRINTYDRQLLRLEATTALNNVLTREKEKARKRQKQIDAEILRGYKEKSAKATRELMQRNAESRKKATESRNRTAMRHQIQRVVSELNTLLLKPSKERHVPEELRIAVAEALNVVNMDTVGADERIKVLNEKIAKAKDPDIIASLTETRDRVLKQGNKLSEKLSKLKEAYEAVRDSTDDSLSSIYDEVIYNKIGSVQKKIGKTPLRDMTLEQLESVYELYTAVLTTVRNSNKAFAEDLKMTRQALGSNTFTEIKENNKARDRIKFNSAEKFLWQNLKPMQAMKKIGSSTLQTLWNNILYGQEVFAKDYDEAVKFAIEMKEKYGYDKWNLDKLYSFESKSGKPMKINLEQMMSIYAYSKRAQADEHIEYGGIVLNEGVIKEKNKLGKTVEVKVNDSTAYRLNKMQVGEIVATLEKEFPGAKDFVDDMQKYLSETMGAKGNEVSMKMYGIRLFKEEHYFPLKSSKDFMEAANAKLKGDVKIKNKGMTKSTVEHARNPIVLENFLDVWGNHVNEMGMYHGLVLPLEDFSRTLNYSFKADEKLNTDAESVRTALHDAFGDNADNYLNELMKAINGGVLHDSSAGIADRMVSKFKKAKVMASLSVIVQQPTAIIRAMGIIEPKYFVAQNFKHKATWEELKKYCPTAIIKETGSFDTNMGRTIVDMVKDDRGLTDKVGDFLGKAPAYMDEMGWNMIWRALKNKVATEQKLSGEELLKECGKQMTLIINETQVYDSVLARNELMRSKSVFAKMATAFNAEPATVANMIYGAILDAKRGKKGIAAKAVAAVISSVVVNGLVSAAVYAMRDDDEDETVLEKYISSATTEVLDGLNPLTYIPFVKDAYSLFQGYDVERTDMALIGDVVDALNSFYNVLDSEEYEGMSGNEIAKHIYENSVPLLTSICDMFGLPVGNVLRDAEALFIPDSTPLSQTSSSGTKYAFKEGLLNTLPEIIKKIIGTDTNTDKLYEAIIDGDTTYVDRLKSGYKDDKAYETALRKALRENDPRIKEAAEAKFNGDFDEYERLFDEIEAEGNFEFDTIKSAINSEFNKLGDSDEDDDSNDGADDNKMESIYSTPDINSAFENGDNTSALEIIDDIVKVKTENYINDGETKQDAEKKAKSSVKSSMSSYWKPLYIAAYKNKDNEEMKRIRNILLSSGLYGRANDVVKTGQDWIKSSK